MEMCRGNLKRLGCSFTVSSYETSRKITILMLSKAVALNWGHLCPLRGISQCLETVLMVRTGEIGGVGASDVY